MRLRTSPGIWLRAAQRESWGPGPERNRVAGVRLVWPSLRFPPVNLLNAPPSPQMARQLQQEHLHD